VSDKPVRAISWGDNIVIAEPAPRAARMARYLAPRPSDIRGTLREDDGGLIFGAVLGSLVGGGMVFGFGGGGVSAISGALGAGDTLKACVWLGFDLLLVAVVAAAYALVARHGIRFHTDSPDEDPVHLALESGNTAWRSLPPAYRHRARHIESGRQ